MSVWFEDPFSRTCLEGIPGQVFLRSFLFCYERSWQPTYSILTLSGVPAPPTTYQCQELPLPPPDSNHLAHWATHTGSPEKGLIPQRCLDLANIR